MPAVVRVIHPAPTAAVVILSFALGAILSAQHGLEPLGWRVWVTTLAVLGSQILTGALNDVADRGRDAIAQPNKPIPSGATTARSAVLVAAAGAALQAAASVPLGITAFALGTGASASAAAYNWWLSATPASVVPYLVSFGVLPFWIATGVGVPADRVAAAPLLVLPFAAAAHLANTARDFDADARVGRRNLAQVVGQAQATGVAWVLAMAAGVGAAAAAVLDGRFGGVDGALGAIGLFAVAQGWGSPGRLWTGMLIAAVAWTAAWAIGTA